MIFAAALGTEFKSVACSITVTMLHLEIQEDRERMKAKRLNKELGTTAGCSQADGSLLKIYRHKGDAWFGSITAVSEVALRGFEAVMQVKQNHGLYPKMVIKDNLKESPGGYTLSLKVPSTKTQF